MSVRKLKRRPKKTNLTIQSENLPSGINSNQTQTLCWTCKKACGKCAWSRLLKPINGWKAIRKDMLFDKNILKESYIVISCPEYKME